MKASYESLLSLWSIQDSLFQQYRTIFITLQSVLISLSVFLLSKPIIMMVFISFLGGYSLYLWVSVCSARAKSVDFCQELILKYENGEDVYNPLTLLKNFQRDNIKNATVLEFSKTRIKMDIYLPRIFMVGWIFIFLLMVMNYLEISVKFINS